MISYAQNSEDVVLNRLFAGGGPGRYVDLGAADPVRDSVTKHFYDQDWRGINVEPVPYLHAALCAARPEDINLAVAIGKEPGHIELHVAPEDRWGWSTTDEQLAAKYRLDGLSFETVRVETITLAQLLDAYPGRVDFLKVDVEGAEADALIGGDWSRHRPRVIVVEATVPNSQRTSFESWEPILVDAGYQMTLFDGLNRFYAERHDIEALEVLAVPANVFDSPQPYPWVEKVRETERDRDEAIRSAQRLERRVAELRSVAEAAIRCARELQETLDATPVL